MRISAISIEAKNDVNTLIRRKWRVWLDHPRGSHLMVKEIFARPLLTAEDVRFIYDVPSKYAITNEGLYRPENIPNK